MKSQNPFFSIKPSGSFAKTLVASNYHGKPYVSITHKPGGLPSENQRAVRDRFSLAKNAWNALTDNEKEVYNERARYEPFTGYNLFIKEYSPDMIKTKKIHISATELINLGDPGIQLLPPPPAGKYYIITSFVGVLHAGDTLFAGIGGSLSISWLPLTRYDFFYDSLNYFITQAGDYISYFDLSLIQQDFFPTDGIYFRCQYGASYGEGNGSLDFSISYYEETI
jgi:hypothetical protein